MQIEEATSYRHPQSVLRQLPKGSRCLLESTLLSETHRWAVLAYEAVNTFKAKGERYWIDDEGYVGAAFEKISELMSALPKPANPRKFPFMGGYMGCVSYESVRLLERIPTHVTEDYDLYFYNVQSFYLFDCVEERVYFLSSEGKIPDLKDYFFRADDEIRQSSVDSDALIDFTKLTLNFTQDSYLQAILHIQECIRDGHTYQVNLSQRMTLKNAADPVNIYAILSKLSPVPFAGFFEWEDTTILSGSPERLFEVNDRSIRTRPIAGTRRRGSEEETQRFLQELALDPKEYAEHAMLVDLARNDLGRISEYGSVHVQHFMDIVQYRSILHTESEIVGTLRSDIRFIDIMRALFPGGTITGVPKMSTMQIIHALEPCARGIYTGALGYWSACGHADFNIMIRAIVCRGDTAHTQAGGGITIKSIPQREYKETLNKARTQVQAILLANGAL